jgi:hypothetical protein
VKDDWHYSYTIRVKNKTIDQNFFFFSCLNLAGWLNLFIMAKNEHVSGFLVTIFLQVIFYQKIARILHWVLASSQRM